MRLGRLPLAVLALAVLASATMAQAQASAPDVLQSLTTSAAPSAEAVGAAGGIKLSTAVEIALLLTVLSVLPALVVTLTSFTRIVIVLSFVRRSLSVNELPPNPVLIALSLFLTVFVMSPVFTRAYEKAYVPYRDGTIGTEQAATTAWGELRGFLVANTRTSEIDLFRELAQLDKPPEQTAQPPTQQPVDDGNASATDALPFRVVVPAFVLSEIKTSFQMGFLLFLPFLLIDLVVASVLISMGMFMLPPVMVSTPFKILLFVLVDGWHLVCQSLVNSFVST